MALVAGEAGEAENRDAALTRALAAVRSRLAAAAEAAGRRVADIELVPITKFFPATDVVILSRLGCRAVIGAYSSAMLDAWVGGCKVIHLPGLIDQETLMGRYSGSPNIHFAQDPAGVAAFLASPWQDDAAETARVDHLSAVLTPPPEIST